MKGSLPKIFNVIAYLSIPEEMIFDGIISLGVIISIQITRTSVDGQIGSVTFS